MSDIPSLDELEALAKTPEEDLGYVAEQAKSELQEDKKGRNIVVLNPAAAEVSRTFLADIEGESRESASVLAGFILSPETVSVEDFIDEATANAIAHKELGYDANGLDALIENIETAAENGKGIVRLTVKGIDNVLPHETNLLQKMDSIVNNPFRIIGLSANCTEREIQRHRAKLTALSNVKKKIITDYDFKPLPQIKRNTESLNSAFSQIENPKNRLLYALFWFTSCGNSDDLAFQYLTGGKTEKAVEIWHTLIESSSITPRKISAMNNLSTLNFLNAFSESQIALPFFRRATRLKLTLFEPDYFEKFAKLVLPKEENIKFDEIIKQFSTLFVANLENSFSHNCNSSELAIDVSEIVNAAKQSTPIVQENLINSLAIEPESKIENIITEIERRHEDNCESVIALGEELYRRTRKLLKSLKSILGKHSIRYEMIANKIASEVLSCAVDYFNANNAVMKNAPFWRTLRLFHRAESLAVSASVNERIKQNITNVEEWETDVEEQKRFSEVESEVAQIKKLLDDFQNQNAALKNASGLVLDCRPLLNTIKEKFGKDDELYITLSSIVVRNSQGMMAEVLNSAHENFLKRVETGNLSDLDLGIIRTALSIAKRLSNLLSNLDMNEDTRQFYQNNNIALQSLNELYAPIKLPTPQRTIRTSKPKNVLASSALENKGVFALTLDSALENPGGFIAILVVGIIIFGCIGNAFFGNSSNNNNSKLPLNNSNKVNYKSNLNIKISPLPSNVKITRPKNGETLFIASKSKGYGSLFIDNGSENDAIAKLVDLSTGKTYQQVYIQSGSSYKINGVKSGNYSLKFSLGKNYSPDAKKFLTNEAFEKFDETLNMNAIRKGNRIEWMNYTASLRKVVGGNARTSPISAAEFADK